MFKAKSIYTNINLTTDVFTNNISYKLAMLTEAEFCEITRQKPATVRANRIKGKGCVFYKIGGSVRYKLVDVIQYIEECKKSSTTHINLRLR